MPSWEVVAQGRVQGVGFRRFVYDCAALCGVKGYAKNMADGSVLIVACADEQTLMRFCERVKSGCYYARVDELQISILEGAKDYHDFSIR